MKRILLATVTPLVLASSAMAQHRPGDPVPTSISSLARSDYGCEVLMCLANPGGPDEFQQCQPPIDRLRRDLRRGRPFPTCNMASGPNGRSYASPSYRAYDECPAGTSALPPGEMAVLEAPMTATPPAAPSGAPTSFASASTAFTYGGIGDGSGYGYTSGDGSAPPAKVCVGGLRGTQTYMSGDSGYTVSTYDTIFVQQAQAPSVIDVFIDDRLWHSVRY